MRREYIIVNTFAEAEAVAPWAAVLIAVEGGFMAFESVTDADTWEARC